MLCLINGEIKKLKATVPKDMLIKNDTEYLWAFHSIIYLRAKYTKKPHMAIIGYIRIPNVKKVKINAHIKNLIAE